MGQQIPIGLVGPSSHTNLAHQTARTINLYPEIGDNDAKEPVALFSTPGLLLLRDLSLDVTSAGEIRACYAMPKSDRLFVVAGNALVEVQTTSSFHVWGNIPSNTGPVGMSSNGDVIVVGDGAGFWAFDLTDGTVAPVLNTGEEPIRGWFSAYLDGRTLYLEKETDQFFWSALDDAKTVDGLSFATAEGTPDPAIAMFVANREIIFVGTASVEFWGPTGDSNNPFARVSGGFRELGCAARWSAAKYADGVAFVGQNDDGHAQVYVLGAAGNAADPISNHAVERDIRNALRNFSAEDVRAFAYTEPGHEFYVLNLPNGSTWAYDRATRLWHQRAELDPKTGNFTTIRQEHHAFWQGDHFVGGTRSAKLYRQSRAFFDLAGDPLVRLRETPHLYAQGQRMRFNALEIAMEVGSGLDGTGQGTDPQLMLQYSDDGGHTYSNEIWRSIGGLGDYLTRVRFGPLGASRDRVFRISVSDPVSVCFVGAWADVDIGR